MNRILSRIIALLLWPMALGAQTATLPPTPVTGTAQIQAQSATCTIPKNGGKCTVAFPAYAAPVTANTKQVVIPVDLSGYSAGFTCSLASGGQFVINPDQSITITGLTCTLKKVAQ
jgi:hypothetical protein